MSSYTQVSLAIRERWNAQAEVLQPTLKRVGPNRSPAPNFKGAFWALDIIEGSSFQLSVSPTVWRRGGLVVISCVVPRGSGGGLLQDLKDNALTIFSDQVLTTSNSRTVRFEGGEIQVGPATNVFAQENVSFPFHYRDPE